MTGIVVNSLVHGIRSGIQQVIEPEKLDWELWIDRMVAYEQKPICTTTEHLNSSIQFDCISTSNNLQRLVH